MNVCLLFNLCRRINSMFKKYIVELILREDGYLISLIFLRIFISLVYN